MTVYTKFPNKSMGIITFKVYNEAGNNFEEKDFEIPDMIGEYIVDLQDMANAEYRERCYYQSFYRLHFKQSDFQSN